MSVNPGPSTKDCHLKFLSLNAQSLKCKHKAPRSEMFCQIHAFQKLLYSNAYDIICVTETWLKDFFLDSEILDTGYTIFRRDRAECEGGGLLIAVKDNPYCRRRSDLETGLEMLCVELNLACSSKIVISAIYRPPDSTPSYDFHSVTEFTSHLNNSARLLKNHSLILGDFNYPAIKWIEGCGFSNSTNSAESAFCETLQDHSLLQVNPFPTRKENILDLIITDAPDRIMNIATLTPIQAGLETDHDLLEFDFVARPRRVKKPARYAYNFKSADFENLKLQIMQSSAISNSVSSNSGVDACWSNWKYALLDIIDANILKARVRNSNTPPWFDKEVRHLLTRKESARRAAKKHNGAFYLEKFRILRKESKALINRKFKEYYTSLGDSLKVNPKHFWGYFCLETKSNSIPANVTYGGRQISSGVEMAEAFNKYFYSTFMHAPEVPLDAFPPPGDRMPVLDSLVLCEDEVYKVLLNLDPSKAPGPDGLPTIVLKTCARELTPSLCALFALFNLSLNYPPNGKTPLSIPFIRKEKRRTLLTTDPSLCCALYPKY